MTYQPTAATLSKEAAMRPTITNANTTPSTASSQATEESSPMLTRIDLNRIAHLLAMHTTPTARELTLKAHIIANVTVSTGGIKEINLGTPAVARMLRLSLSGARKIKRRVIRHLGGSRIDRDLVRFGSCLSADPCTPASDNVVGQSIDPTTDEVPASALNPAKRLQELLDYRWDII